MPESLQPDLAARLLPHLMEEMSAGVALFDLDGRRQFASRRFDTLLGLPEALRVPGTTLIEQFGERAAQIEAMLAGGERAAIDWATGALHLNLTLLPTPGLGLLLLLRDMTEMRQALAEIQEEQAKLATIVDNLPDGVMLYDAAFRCRMTNRRMVQFQNFPPEFGAPGKSGHDILRYQAERGDFGPVAPGEMDALVEERVAMMRKPGGNRYTRHTAGGYWVEFNMIPLEGGGLLAFYRDITLLKQQEAQIAEERSLLREILDSSDALAVLLDKDGVVVLANDRHRDMMGTPDEFYRPGTSLADAVRWRYQRGVYGFEHDEETTVRLRVGNAFSGGRVQYARKMPSGRWVESLYTPISQGRLVGFSRDITPLKENEQAALQAKSEAEAARDAAEAAAQAKSAFLAAMSHEIRTPMNGVLGMLEVLGRDDLLPDQRRAVTVMRESAQSLLRIIDDLLDFSKIEAGRLDLEAAPFHLGALLEGTVETFTPEAKRRGLTLFADTPGEAGCWVLGDVTRVRQILFNLTGNALKFTERGFVRVTLALRADGDAAEVAITIEDSGIGMDEPTVQRLFQPFTQADSSTTRRFGGTGLGLSIVRRLAALMGGDVAAESMPGRGSRFTVTLRLAFCEAPEEAPPRLPGTSFAAGEGRVLVVDDHPVNREVLQRQLELLGVETIATAADGEQALSAWRLARPPVMLLDIHMPVMDGFELARAIRMEERQGGLPRTLLIAVTANALKGEAERCYAAGMDGFVAKPVTLEALAEALGRGFAPAGTELGEAAMVFDAAALRGLFGDDPGRLRSILESFAAQARLDLASMAQAEPGIVQAAAHRLKSAARLVGARQLANIAGGVEAAVGAGDWPEVSHLPALLEETLAEARDWVDSSFEKIPMSMRNKDENK